MSEVPPPSTSRLDPLHGVTLKALLTWLVDHYGFETLGELIPINCFLSDPASTPASSSCDARPGHAPRSRRSTSRRQIAIYMTEAESGHTAR
ncbi:VF530 family DNA-binding protein [Cobetia marina]